MTKNFTLEDGILIFMAKEENKVSDQTIFPMNIFIEDIFRIVKEKVMEL